MDPLTHELDDARLIDAVGRGDQQALAEAYRRHGDGVYGLVRRVLADGAMAEEVTQEVFLRLWNEPHRFDADRGALRSFLLRQAHSRAVERVRSEEARRRREERVDRENVPPQADVEQQAMDGPVLPGRGRRPGHPQRGRARGHRPRLLRRPQLPRTWPLRLDLPEGTVKSRIRLGLAKLADRLEATGLGINP